MSTNPNSGYTGHDSTSATHNTSESQGGIVDTVRSYIPGLSPTSSRNNASGTQDATTEPAFGAGVGPNAGHSSTHTGAGSTTFGSTTSGPHGSDLSNSADPRVDSDNSRFGSSNTGGLGSGASELGSSSAGYGSTSTGYGSSTTSGPHSSNLANQADPRVDSDNSRFGSSNTSGLGSSHTGTGGLGSSSTGYGSSTTSGPHSSNLANQADPRVDSDNSRLGSSNTSGLGSTRTERDGYTPAPTLNPHDEERAKVVAARATGAAGGPYEGGVKSDYGNSSSGLRDGRVGESTGLGATGAGIGSGAALGSGIGHESGRGSGVGSGVGLGSGHSSGLDSSREAGYGSGAGLDSSRGSGVGSGVGLGSDSRTGRDSLASGGDHPSTYNDTRRGSDDPREKTDRAAAGRSEGATAEESQASATPRHTEGGHQSSSKRENRDAIPTAGGVKLGEKHWGESGIVPDDPKPRAEENISSSSGQPDR